MIAMVPFLHFDEFIYHLLQILGVCIILIKHLCSSVQTLLHIMVYFYSFS